MKDARHIRCEICGKVHDVDFYEGCPNEGKVRRKEARRKQVKAERRKGLMDRGRE